MTLLRKEDTAKAGKLIGAIVVVFGLAAWRVASAISPARPADPAPETVGSGSAASGSAPAPAATLPTNGASVAPASAKADDALIHPTRPVLGSMVDPFRTIAPARVPILAAPRPIASLAGSLPAGPLPAPLPDPATTAKPAPAAPAVEEPAARVTGILGGANATAVVETGKETCVVRVGSRLPDGTEVVAIGATTVTLRKGGKTRLLDVGN